jgi:hypothetical protein
MKKLNLKPKVNVKKTIATAAVGVSLLAFFTIELVSTSRASFPRLLNISIEQMDIHTGLFTAEGVSADKPDQMWEVSGRVVGDKLEFEMSDINSSYRIIATGKVDKDGVIIGRAASEDGEAFEWEASDALGIRNDS